jgi:excisionase family DNA binding protein
MTDDILTVDQVAALLDCTPVTIEAKARDAELPAVKFGRSWVFPRTALLEVLHAKALANTHKVQSPKAVKVASSRPVLVGL